MPDEVLECWRAYIHPEHLDAAGRALSRRSGALAWGIASTAVTTGMRTMAEVWRKRLLFWSPAEEANFTKAVAAGWDRVQDSYTYARSAEWRPHSPNVLPLSLDELKFAEWNGIYWRDYLKGSPYKLPFSLEALRKRARFGNYSLTNQ